MTDECIHGMTDASCSICLHPRRPSTRTPGPRIGKVITARFSHKCAACDERIYEGDRLGIDGDEWIHIEHFEVFG